MPVKAVKRGGKWRVVEARTGQIVTNRQGTPVDGGGKSNKGRVEAQARAINANMKS